MSLFESGHATGEISLAGLLEGEPAASKDPGIAVADIAERVTVGGWPASQTLTTGGAARAARDYLAQIRNVDVSRVGGSRRDPQKMERLLASLARNVATEVDIVALARDAGGDEGALARGTVYEYLEVLERLMIVENQPAWSPHMRSRATLRSAPKRHFVDPSLAVAALGGSPQRLLRDLKLLGLLYESLVIRDLRVFAQPLEGAVYHYRDQRGHEVDVVVQLSNGRWGAFEIKLGAGKVDEAAQSLRKFAALVDPSRSGMPAVLAVIVGAGYGYVRPDGVAVVPIGSLGP